MKGLRAKFGEVANEVAHQVRGKFVARFPAPPLEQQLDGFRAAQRLAMDSAVVISQELREGWTERRTAKLMDTYLRDHGVKSFFHKSFAWFGDRSSFHDFGGWRDFLPSERVFQAEVPIILDTAPILNGYVGDIGFSYNRVEQPEFQAQRTVLARLRKDLPLWFSSELTTDQIWRQVEQSIHAAGFSNCYQRYPLRVLGHRLHYLPLGDLPGLTAPFSWHAIVNLLGHGILPDLITPQNPVTKVGLWAIEPHLGNARFGTKFEEILVVGAGEAHWLERDNASLNAGAEGDAVSY